MMYGISRGLRGSREALQENSGGREACYNENISEVGSLGPYNPNGSDRPLIVPRTAALG